jgi:hypothetical protein
LGRSPLPITLWKKGLLTVRRAWGALEMMSVLGGQKRPLTMKMPKTVHDLVVCDRRRDLRSFTREVVISLGSVQPILTGIYGMSKVSARWVSRQLTDGEKQTSNYVSILNGHACFRYECQNLLRNVGMSVSLSNLWFPDDNLSFWMRYCYQI